MGRPSTYKQETAELICKELSKGRTLKAICREEGMPPESTVREWVLDDSHGFAALYARARDFGLDAMADELFDISDDGSNDYIQTEDGEITNHEHINRSRLRVDTRKWYLAKLAPKRYGDRLMQEHTGPDGNALVFRVEDARKPKE